MGIDSLIGGTIWDEYSEKVTNLMNNPQNMGEITQEQADEMGAKLIVADGANFDIYIRYLGACSGCASSSTGTLFAIENILKEKLDEGIRVLPI